MKACLEDVEVHECMYGTVCLLGTAPTLMASKHHSFSPCFDWKYVLHSASICISAPLRLLFPVFVYTANESILYWTQNSSTK